MLVQVIEGRTSDADGLRRQLDRWVDELRPTAVGFLGSTGGVTDDGRVILVARFESPEAARANSDREQQGQWWGETEKYLDGPATFVDSTDVELYRGGGSDEAGFVQVMKSHGLDRDRVHALDKVFEEVGPSFRPDLLGMLRVWTGPGDWVEVGYFSSEAEARENEAKEPPPELQSMFAEYQDLMEGVEFIDLHEPRIIGGTGMSA